ncbi:Alpha/Beta hydrolase protein [Boeremia exigua]|uniref:Alpha/Beta hydrolase protein n=1 Tax=Boeremia exigua TaxID=749465 RepID=UPI001E8CECCE|nr:Alpha/Beta hydrolase protein [Boeremia exigua]KAH6628991.1 Alpha/Beta hydrolase protein [Boeremia exigua]
MITLTKVLALLSLSSLVTSSPTPQPGAPVAVLANGSYYGVYNAEYDQDFFLGMPYAQAPVGDLRLARPQSLNTSWSSSRNATQYGFSCIGYGPESSMASQNDEDCLNLAVIRPARVNETMPVLVWIHGGGFTEGSSSTPYYNTSFLVQRSQEIGEPILAVSINYRLAAWGFMWSDQIVEQGLTNVGMRDQRMALHWVQENIAAFGGDPSRVTIMGESAGAVSVNKHILAFNGRDDGLFQQVISQSGPAAGQGPWERTQEKLGRATLNITETLCPDAEDQLACLRRVDTKALDDAIKISLTIPSAGSLYGPVPDGDFMTGSSAQQLKEGNFPAIRYLIGSCTDEASLFVDTGINSDSELHDTLSGIYMGLNFTSATTLMSAYSSNDNDLGHQGLSNTHLNATVGYQYRRLSTIMTDAIWKAGVHFTAEQWNVHNKSEVFVYNAEVPFSTVPQWVGASHGFDLAYMFNNVNGSGWEGTHPPWEGPNPLEGLGQPSLDLARDMSAMWVGFINSGVPKYDQQTSPEWPAYRESDQQIYYFAAGPTGLNNTVGKEQRVSNLKLMASLVY